MEFDCFDFENPQRLEKTEEEKHLERIQTGFVQIQQASMIENRLIKQEDLKKKRQNKALSRLSQTKSKHSMQKNCICYEQERNWRQCVCFPVQNDNQSPVHQQNQENYSCQEDNMKILNERMWEEEEEEEEDDSQYLLEDEILLDLDFFNKKGDENIDKCIMEKVSIWNDVRPVIQVVAKKNRIEIIYDNGHRLLKDFKFLIKKLEQYKDNKDAKLASELLQDHQKNIELEEQMLERITIYYDHELNILFEMISKNYQKSKQMAYEIIDAQDQTTYFAFSIRKLNCEGGIQHISGPFGYSKPLIEVFGGDMETYIRFIMRKGVIEHFDRQSHFIIFLMKLRIVTETDLNVVTLDNIKIPISVSLQRHSLSRLQIMPECFKEDYLKIYKIEIKKEILQQLLEMRRSKEQFQNTIQGLEDFEYFMQSQIFYDKYYKRQRQFSDSALVCRYRYLDRLATNRYIDKSQRRNCEHYLLSFLNSFKIKKKCKYSSKKVILSSLKANKEVQIDKNNQEDKIDDEEIIKSKPDFFHHDISVDSQTIKQEEVYEEQLSAEQILDQKYTEKQNERCINLTNNSYNQNIFNQNNEMISVYVNKTNQKIPIKRNNPKKKKEKQ